MRLNPVNALIAVLLGAVLSYGLWSLDGPLRNYVAAGSAIFFIATLLPLLLGGYASARRGVNLRVVSGVFFGIALGLNTLFAIFDLSATAYIVISAVLILVYLLLANAIFNARQ
ncbi:hypothetical protein MASR1M42_06520 [Azonexus hydrophilus]|jgi:drug/metabolite transporter (DMT)-like permease|uniref:hypothetical protein n=1 Tax=Azonexus hydrophilus TaxID=418702 RepID=UPI0017763D08|nr:hypothetical protein [Azonexus hydrophilus]MBP8022234.1 hypothetical protein [Azonexus sp.]MBP8194696.1 hypothetical protein [Azonexus sp.]MDX9736516.1 hypothetical protein [Azonexus sp.]HHV48799.1 hypothetical protein [Rhodocyclaceae bacterium]